MPDEVAVFIDLENLRYSLLNNFGYEPDFQALITKARKYGRPSVMKAYAHFTEHPPELTRQLEVVGITPINVAVKRTTISKQGRPVERVKNAADMVLSLDAIVEALESDAREQSKVFLLVTGDRDYVKLVTLLRHRFGQRVVISGVPGSIARDLIESAGEEDPIEAASRPPEDPKLLKIAIVRMVKALPGKLRYWSVRIIDQWAQDARSNIPGTAKERRDTIAALFREMVLLQREIMDPRDPNGQRRVTETYLDETKAKQLGYL